MLRYDNLEVFILEQTTLIIQSMDYGSHLLIYEEKGGQYHQNLLGNIIKYRQYKFSSQ